MALKHKKSAVKSGTLKGMKKYKTTPPHGKHTDRVSKTAADIDSVRPKRGFAGATAEQRRSQVKIRAVKGGYEATLGRNLPAARSGKLKVSKVVKKAVRKKK